MQNLKEALMLYPELSKSVFDAAFAVHRKLGPGLLELPYHNALYLGLKQAGLAVIYNAPFEVSYLGETVGEYLADLAVDGKVIIEVKAVAALTAAHTAQLINYLRISGLKLGFLFNFAPVKMEFKRVVV